MEIDLFDFGLVLDWAMAPFEWLLDLGPVGGAPGRREQQPPTQSEMGPLLASAARRLKVAELAQLERDRRAGRLDLTEFRRRYSELAGGSPSEDPAGTGRYGPNTEAIQDVLARIGRLSRSEWTVAEEHLRNLHANPAVRFALPGCYRAALEAAIASARLSAAAATELAVRERIPVDRRATWGLALTWLALALAVYGAPLKRDAGPLYGPLGAQAANGAAGLPPPPD